MNAFETIDLPGAQLRFDPVALSKPQADRWFEHLSDTIDWQEESIKMFGKTIKVPRQVAWYGDPQARYRYSGVMHEPIAWSEVLADIKHWVGECCGHSFNSMLANLYRDGSDAMGWHADNEPELGEEPVIASLSLGAQRRMRFRPSIRPIDRGDTTLDRRGQQTFHLDLTHGSLLVMQGQTQHQWQHAISRTRRPVGPRINLTFRQIKTPKGDCQNRKSGTRR
ncbi:MAG: alpha-ketoglutarate-dependent dioxygenase AlkB [Lysobacterales bacterium]